MKARKHNGYATVNFTADDVRAFNATFPCSEILEREGSVQFAPNGDLIDSPEWLGGTGVLAFIDDCQTFANGKSMKTFSIRTDSDSGTLEASDLTEAIREYFGATSVRSLREYFARIDGAWCRIDCDGERVVEIGIDR
jgi:hypothetical protein